MFHLLTIIFYQPFLNVLLLIYSLLGYVMENPDMGIAVIVFTIFIRILLFPLSMASNDSDEDLLRIGVKYEKLKKDLESKEPLKYQKAKQDLVKEHRGTVRFEMINIGIQLAIAIILWVIFEKGLSGEHDYLIYSWMPEIPKPYNLMFLGHIDLAKPNFTFNLINTALLFTVETLDLAFSPIRPTQRDRIIQFTLPALAFLYFRGMPAGKKLFIISTLTISIVLLLIRETGNAFNAMQKPKKSQSHRV